VFPQESWVNLNNKGDWNDLHSHGSFFFTLAGAYFVTSGYGDDTEDQVTSLQFRSPRGDQHNSTDGGGVMEDQLGRSGEQWSDPALGHAGTLALWPAYLPHYVPPHSGTEERISICKDIFVQKRLRKGSEMGHKADPPTA